MQAIGVADPRLYQPLYEDGGLDQACRLALTRRDHRPSKQRDLLASIIASLTIMLDRGVS